jgi:hypothetical protein
MSMADCARICSCNRAWLRRLAVEIAASATTYPAHARIQFGPVSIRQRIPNGSDSSNEIWPTDTPKGTAQSANMNVNCPQADPCIGRPECCLQLISGMHPMWISHEMLQQTKFCQAEVDHMTTSLNAICYPIQAEVTKAQMGSGLGRRLALAVCQVGVNALQQPIGRERSPDTFVDARFQQHEILIPGAQNEQEDVARAPVQSQR